MGVPASIAHFRWILLDRSSQGDRVEKILTAFVVMVSLALPLRPQRPPKATDWDPWRFLIGEWVAEGGGQPGQGTGSFSFDFELRGNILVRKNRAEYPATKEHPSSSHEDLMVIYPEGGPSSFRAVYFDSEGHVIHYTAGFSEDGKTFTFLSDLEAAGPRFRLSYTKAEGGSLSIKFEIAPPGRPDQFTTYVEGVARQTRTPRPVP